MDDFAATVTMKHLKLFESLNFDELIKEVRSRYFDPYPHIVLDQNLEGYKIKDNKIHIGGKIAYLKNNIQAMSDGLFHEMGHFVSITDKKRLAISSYGLDYSTHNGYPLPLTWNAIKNECHAILWQDVLCKHFKIKFNFKDFVKSLRLMEDYINVPLKGCYYDSTTYKWYHDKSFKKEVSYSSQDDFKHDTIVDFMNDQLSITQYNIINFDLRWHERCDFIKTLL